MGNTNEGEESGGWKCTANRQDRKHNKTKSRRKMTESVVLEEYGNMVQEGLQRQKAAETELNNNIRGSYMDRLGVKSGIRDIKTDPNMAHATSNNRTSNFSADTYALENRRSNITMAKDQTSPKEIQRTTMAFNQSSVEISALESDANGPNHRRQSSNVAGYFSTSPSNQALHRQTMPAPMSKTPRMVSSHLLQPSQATQNENMNQIPYVSPPNENGESASKGTEIEEENKEEAVNEELFKHLSYLSQLSHDVQKHQQIEQAGPGDYKIKVFDSSAASPASAKLLRDEDSKNNTTGNKDKRYQNLSQLDEISKFDTSEELKTPTQGRRSRISTHLGRMNSENRLSTGVTLRLQNQSLTSQEEPMTPTSASGTKLSSLGSHVRGGSQLRRIGTDYQIQDSSNLRSTSRSNQQIRTQLLSRLTYDKIWLRPQDKPKISQTCIIFDWDDTILCTTFLAPHQHLIYEPNLKFPPTLQKRLSELDDVADDLLVKAKTFGKVYIVTNAAQGWVELSANRFLPKVFKTLQSDVTIISARTKYEKLYPRNYQKWKVQAFLETRADMEDDAITNLIALGDNIFEIEAAYILGNQFKSAFIKTVKFRQSPSTSELIKQIKLVLTQFDLICNSPKNLTVRLLKQSRGEEQQARDRAAAREGTMPLDSGTATSAAIMQNLNKNADRNPSSSNLTKATGGNVAPQSKSARKMSPTPRSKATSET